MYSYELSKIFHHYFPPVLLLILCFLPLIIGIGRNFYLEKNTEILADAIRSNELFCVIIGSLSICFDISLHHFVDCSFILKFERNYILPRIGLLLVCVFTLLFTLLLIVPQKSIHIIPCIFSARQYLLIHILLSMLKGGCPVIHLTNINIIQVLTGIVFVINAASAYLAYTTVIYNFLFYTSTVLKVFITVYGFYYIHCVWYFNILRKPKGSTLTTEECYCTAFCNISCCYVMALWAALIFHRFRYWQNLNTSYIVTTLVLDTILIAVVNIAVAYISKREFIKIQEKMDVKGMFVRYIAHELRSPLHVVNLGLQLLKKSISDLWKNSNNDENLKNLSLLDDTMQSCTVMGNTLEELKLYDSIESEAMELEFSEVLILGFIYEAVKPFVAQALQLGVQLAIVVSPQEMLELQDCVILIDAYKMSQVIRNLLATALKTSQRGGRILVELSQLQPQPVRSRDAVAGGSRDAVAGGSRDAVAGESRDAVAVVGGHADCEEGGGGEAVPEEKDAETLPVETQKLLRIAVKDSGHGCSKDFQSKVSLSPLHKIATEKQYAEMAYWISRGLVHLHNGYFEVYSAGPGLGTTVIIDLPMATAAPPPPPGATATTTATSEAAGGGASEPDDSSRFKTEKIVDYNDNRNGIIITSSGGGGGEGRDWFDSEITRNNNFENDTDIEGGGGAVGRSSTITSSRNLTTSNESKSNLSSDRYFLSQSQSMSRYSLSTHDATAATAGQCPPQGGSQSQRGVGVTLSGQRRVSRVVFEQSLSMSIHQSLSCSGNFLHQSPTNNATSSTTTSSRYAALLKDPFSLGSRSLPGRGTESRDKANDALKLVNFSLNMKANQNGERQQQQQLHDSMMVKKVMSAKPAKRKTVYQRRSSFLSSLVTGSVRSNSSSSIGSSNATNHSISCNNNSNNSNNISNNLTKVLIVEDSAVDRRMLSRLLEHFAVTCAEAVDGLDAVALISQSLAAGQPYDVVLMNRHMPNMGGLAAARKMRELGYRGIVVGLSGDAELAEIQQFLDRGADVVLVKPVQLTDFESVFEMHAHRLGADNESCGEEHPTTAAATTTTTASFMAAYNDIQLEEHLNNNSNSRSAIDNINNETPPLASETSQVKRGGSRKPLLPLITSFELQDGVSSGDNNRAAAAAGYDQEEEEEEEEEMKLQYRHGLGQDTYYLTNSHLDINGQNELSPETISPLFDTESHSTKPGVFKFSGRPSPPLGVCRPGDERGDGGDPAYLEEFPEDRRQQNRFSKSFTKSPPLPLPSSAPGSATLPAVKPLKSIMKKSSNRQSQSRGPSGSPQVAPLPLPPPSRPRSSSYSSPPLLKQSAVSCSPPSPSGLAGGDSPPSSSRSTGSGKWTGTGAGRKVRFDLPVHPTHSPKYSPPLHYPREGGSGAGPGAGGGEEGRHTVLGLGPFRYLFSPPPPPRRAAPSMRSPHRIGNSNTKYGH